MASRQVNLLGGAGRLSRIALATVWACLLASPAVTTFYFADEADVQPAWSLAASATFFLAAWLAIPSRIALACSYPLVLLALACTVGALQRDVNVLELAAQWRTFTRGELADALGPYVPWFAAAAVVLAIVAAVVWPTRGPRRTALRWRLAGAALLAGLFFCIPGGDRARAWPVNALLVTAAAATDTPMLGAGATIAMSVSPRDPASSWDATQAPGANARQTFVFVVGETVRADFLEECGGPARVQPVRGGALVACDVTAGANVTSASVPLLISRELPGHEARVSADGTFQRAFAEAGFSTYWFGTQAEAVAWPDAEARTFSLGPDSTLLGMLDRTLARGTGHVSIALHVWGAHTPYCVRFERASAPYPDACDRLGSIPTQADLATWRAMYANAVDGSVGFVNTVIERLEKVPGEAFLLYTADHGENLLDDRRALFAHALRRPTRWDIHVPAIFWANAAWKAAHPAAWRMLQANARQPLMHADMVPTVLAAAGIRYRDTRPQAANLLAAPVPQRERIVQKALGFTTSWELLVREAEENKSRAPDPGVAATTTTTPRS
jgi:glucan phosphoethanolaminetransferase (alkaline phosphatase superfamily)